MSIASGINFHGFSNFIIPLTNEFGWSRTVISAAFSFARLESGLLGPIEGFFVDRIGPRRLMLVGIPLMGIGYILLSRVNSLVAFFLVYILAITLGNSLGMSTPMTTAVANWFNRKRGLAFGIMWSGVGLGGLLVPALGWTIDRFGWRDAAMFVGIGLIVVGVPIVDPIVSGYVFDITASYTIAFLAFPGASVVSMVLLLFAKPPKRPTRPQGPAGSNVR